MAKEICTECGIGQIERYKCGCWSCWATACDNGHVCRKHQPPRSWAAR